MIRLDGRTKLVKLILSFLASIRLKLCEVDGLLAENLIRLRFCAIAPQSLKQSVKIEREGIVVASGGRSGAGVTRRS
jgi:hypothetical protein